MVLDSKQLLDRYVNDSSTTIVFKKPIQDLAIKEVEDEDNLQLSSKSSQWKGYRSFEGEDNLQLSSKFCQSQLLKPKRREDNLIVLSCMENYSEVVWGKEKANWLIESLVPQKKPLPLFGKNSSTIDVKLRSLQHEQTWSQEVS